MIRVGCPGIMALDGTIERGGQNLPGGGWEGHGFNLPARLTQTRSDLCGRPTAVALHNDVVVQGLGEVRSMQDVERWGVLTISTGLGSARFSNQRPTLPDTV